MIIFYYERPKRIFARGATLFFVGISTINKSSVLPCLITVRRWWTHEALKVVSKGANQTFLVPRWRNEAGAVSSGGGYFVVVVKDNMLFGI